MLVVAGLNEPHIFKKDRIMFILNDVFVLFVAYHLLSLTELVYDPYTRQQIGYSMIAVTCTAILINLGLFFYIAVQEVYHSFKIIYQKCKLRLKRADMMKKQK